MSSEASAIGGDQSTEALRLELVEAREQQAATAEILAAISSSRTSPDGIFTAIAATAARLCGAYDTSIFERVGDHLRIVAHHRATVATMPIGQEIPLTRGRVVGRAVLDKRTIHIADLQSETDQFPEGSEFARRLGHRSIVSVPLMRAGEAIGAISIRRAEVRPFTGRQIELLKSFADQAVIAIENTRLFEAEQTRTRELMERTRELTESLGQQTATSEVLRVISSSPGELQPVFEAILANVVRICGAKIGNLFLREGEVYRHVAMHGAPAEFAELRRRNPLLRPAPSNVFSRLAVTKQAHQTVDARQSQAYLDRDQAAVEIVEVAGARTLLIVPMLKEDDVIGAIGFFRQEVRPFTEKQIELVKSFASQAVIAIENARLLEAEQASKRELQESLEYQTAISNVLGVISASPSDVRPAYQNIVETAYHLCRADRAGLWRLDEGRFHIVASVNPLTAHPGHRAAITSPLDRSSLAGRVGLEGRTVHIPDILVDPEYDKFRNRPADDRRSMLGVPLLRLGQVIGAIILSRTRVEPFSQAEIRLVETFADQAVIAIENTRLFEAEQARTREVTERTLELAESLEYQTAISDVLGVIGRSKFELQPVLAAILSTATRLCQAEDGSIGLRQGDWIDFAFNQGSSWRPRVRLPVAPGSLGGRAVLERKTIHIEDVSAALDEFPLAREHAASRGHRTALAVPLLRENEAIGCLFLRRTEVRPFSDKQIALLGTFADQAVIAIENARLLNELRDSLEQQTATAEVLRVISNSPGQLEPVFQAMLANAVRICEAKFGTLFRYDGGAFRAVAFSGVPRALVEYQQQRGSFRPELTRGGTLLRVWQIKDVVHSADASAELDPGPAVRYGGARSILGVPMFKESELVGVIIIYRQEVRPFTDKQIDLVKSFASQAVIAIENARLLEELQTRQRELVLLCHKLRRNRSFV
jgi:GAF domain-containing protein